MDMHCGTLVYRRRIWEELARFQPVVSGEDVLFVQDAFARGARILKLPARSHFVYIRHSTNTWPFASGSAWDARTWQPAALPDCMPEPDRRFYEHLARSRA